jgi:multidrug efflux pump subunit AcrA (membrane-fusion protein)
VDVHNPDDALVSGMYAEVKLRLKQNDDALSVPIEAVTRNGSEASVLLVDRDNRISDRKITIGLESADRLQVLSGLDEGDRVVVGNRSQFRTGELVDPKPIALRKTAQEF